MQGEGDGRGREALEPQAAVSMVAEASSAPAEEIVTEELPDEALFINRDLSLLAFFERVLDEARDGNNPLLERLKFIGIAQSILGEFFMVRMAGLRQQVEAGVTESVDGYTPQQLLPLVRERALAQMIAARECFRQIVPELEAVGIHFLAYSRLDATQREALASYFEARVFPVLTPLAFDPGRPFPHISSMSHNLAVVVRDPSGEEHFARVKVPDSLPRLIPVPAPEGAEGHWFIWLEELIAAHLSALFPGMEVVESSPFRVTRDADLTIQEAEADDLLETIERFVRRRRFGSVIRVTTDHTMPEHIRQILKENLELEDHDLYVVDSPLGLGGLLSVGQIDAPELKYPPLVQTVPAPLNDAEGVDIFAAIRQRDILLHHPYDSFDPVVDFVMAAAKDPDVLAIKTTLYRVGRNAPVVDALMEAAANGKQVAALIELKARFDEESNIGWAKALEQEGVHVIYGLVGLKTHSKIMLVVRNEGERIRRYVHLGTGNYNSVTSKQYTDIGYLTCNEDLGADASAVFNSLTGYSTGGSYRKFLVAPHTMRRGLEERIDREIEHARRGEEAHLIFKMNALIDKPMIRRLYAASQAGVKVDLIVRGMCCLRPGVPGVSDNITERSIVGRFLEHSRIFWFRNGGGEEVLLGSADLMPRNLNRRVEILFPVQDPGFVQRLRHEVLETYLADNLKARELHADGTWQHIRPCEDETPMNSQEWFVARAREAARGEEGGAP